MMQGALNRLGGGVANAGAGGMAQGFDDTNKNSLISDIRNYFTRSVRAGMLPSGQMAGGSQTSQIL
jgi:hypothetical protein